MATCGPPHDGRVAVGQLRLRGGAAVGEGSSVLGSAGPDARSLRATPWLSFVPDAWAYLVVVGGCCSAIVLHSMTHASFLLWRHGG